MEKKTIVALLILIIILGTAIRAMTGRFDTFLESDVYIYMSVAQQTMANGWHITSTLSSFPPHQFNEKPLLIYFPIVLQYLTGSIYQAIRIIPLILGALTILATYKLAQLLTRDARAGLLSAFVIATLPAAIGKTSIGEYRGEAYLSFITAVALICFILWLEGRETQGKGAAWLLLGGIAAVAIGIATWSGAIYSILVLAVAATMFLVERKAGLFYGILIGSLIGIALFMFYIYGGVNYLNSLISDYSFSNPVPQVTTSVSIAEEQPVNLFFLVGSYGWALVFAPIGLLLLLKGWTAGKPKYALMAVISLFLITFLLQTTELRYSTLMAVPMAIFAAIAALWIADRAPRKSAYLFMSMLVAFSVIMATAEQMSYTPADNINPNMVQAMMWLHNSTPADATVLTAWSDGSLVEGIAQRASWTDSMQGGIGQPQFSDWLFAAAGNESYLQTFRPSYILVRHFWANETYGLRAEGNLPILASDKGTNYLALENATFWERMPANISATLVFNNSDSMIYQMRYS